MKPPRVGPWTGRVPRRPRTRVRSQEVCPWCGLLYEKFNSGITFAAAQEHMLERARALAEAGDYSKPARTTGILGFMREWKLAAWKRDHLYWCHPETRAEMALCEASEEPPF